MSGAARPLPKIVTLPNADVLPLKHREIRSGARGYTTPVTKRERLMPNSIRMKPSLQAQIKRIAAAERRTKNNWIVMTLEDAVRAYLDAHPELNEDARQERPS